MGNGKISPSQLFSLLFLFELGSAVVVGLGMQAKQDAWIAILLGLLGGICLFMINQYLVRRYPDLPLTGYLPKILGPYIGYPIAILYILYFLYIAARVLRDFGELLLTTTFPETPMLAIHTIMICLIGYASMLGIETIARAGQIFFVVLLLLGMLGIMLVAGSGLIKTENFLPVLENGWKPVLSTAFPLTLTFPFGELIVFTMVFPYANPSTQVMKTGLYGILASGLVLALTVAIDIAVLGVQASNQVFPLLATVEKVNIANIIVRMDIISIATLILGGFFKITLFFYGAVTGIADVFRIRKPLYIIVPLSLIVLSASMQIAGNLPRHLEIGLKYVPYYLHLPFQVGIPLLMLLVAVIQKRFHIH